jgi:KTSC domain
MPLVDSTAILRIHYDAELSTLSITFKTGRRYEYFDVEPEVYRAFLAADSRGGFFNHHIRDRYRFRELR